MYGNHAYDKLIELVKIGGIVDDIQDLLDWDHETMMPDGDSERRSQLLEYVERLSHRHSTDPRIGELLDTITVGSLTEDEQINVREIRRDYERRVRIPEELEAEFVKTRSIAQMFWRRAREENDFSGFLPHLEALISLARERAHALRPDSNVYDVMLDEFEPDSTTAMYDVLFKPYLDTIPNVVTSLREKVQSGKYTKLLKREVKQYRQAIYLRQLAEYAGYDFKRGRIDRSIHPFSSASGRITYSTYDSWMSAIYSVLHEIGHAKYEHGLPQEHRGTPLGEPASWAVHESQSRLWENHVGKSRMFWEGQYAHLTKAYRPLLRWVKLDEFFKIINLVEPCLIRVNADELSYGLHVILRYELEKKLMDGTLLARDVPGAWNELSTKLLGTTPTSDTLGCLQDVHWSWGSFGYFPTYLYGSILAAQFWEAIERGVPNRDWLVAHGKFQPIDEWLHEYVYSRGRKYRTRELVRQATGSAPNCNAYVNYLVTKYGELYKIP